ncbi:MAG TPA: hypothetical protein VGN95_02075 [Pyrinomonadaceae bacterium]|nr:hypothetical protein [Pyrinomonadaceae bacterium]
MCSGSWSSVAQLRVMVGGAQIAIGSGGRTSIAPVQGVHPSLSTIERWLRKKIVRR